MYEQVVLELLEAGERDLAKEILHVSEPLIILKSAHPEKYMKLEHFCRRPFFNASDAYEMGSSKELRRQEIADSLACEVSVVEPSRLLSIIGKGLRFQQSEGSLPKGVGFDLFRGTKKAAKRDIDEKIPKVVVGDIVLSNTGKAELAAFSPDGTNVVSASTEGCIEMWDSETRQLREDLIYQQKGEFMFQDSCVLSSTFSKDGHHLATGSQNGCIKIWKISTGVCLRKFNNAHPLGITSLMFARDGTQILSASHDQTARIHGLKSGKTLKEFRGHTSYVNVAMYTKDGGQSGGGMLSASSDGTIKLWDIRTTDCLLTFRPGMMGPSGGPSIRETAVHTLQWVPGNPDQVFVCTRSAEAYIFTLQGQLVKTFSSGKRSGGDFLCATLSPQGKFVYCVGEDGVMYIFDMKSTDLEHVLTVSSADKEILSVVHHPHRNMMLTVGADGKIQLWKP